VVFSRVPDFRFIRDSHRSAKKRILENFHPLVHKFLFFYFLTFLTRSHFSMNIHWSCHCTVNAYVVCHICDTSIMWRYVVETSLFFVYICVAIGYPIIKRECWNPSNPLYSHTYLWMSQARTWISNATYRGLFALSDLRWDMLLPLVDNICSNLF
jgi:hypothetical protein